MTMSIGGVTVTLTDQGDLGGSSLPFGRKQRWVSNPALGLVGSIQQMTGTDPLKGRVHWALSAATMVALQALYDAQASGGGPYEWKDTDLPEPYLSGFDVVINEFDPTLGEGNRGLPWYDVFIGFEEVVS